MVFVAFEKFTAGIKLFSTNYFKFKMLLHICETKIRLDINILTKVNITDLYHYLK